MAPRAIKRKGSPSFNLNGQVVPVKTLDDARRLWLEYRNATMIGASGMVRGCGNFYDETGTLVAYVSYNGRMWTGSAEELRTHDARIEIK